MGDKKGVIIFKTTTSAIRSEKITKKEGLDVKLIPTPREYSTDCGISLLFSLEDREKVINILNEKKIEISDIHEM